MYSFPNNDHKIRQQSVIIYFYQTLLIDSLLSILIHGYLAVFDEEESTAWGFRYALDGLYPFAIAIESCIEEIQITALHLVNISGLKLPMSKCVYKQIALSGTLSGFPLALLLS